MSMSFDIFPTNTYIPKCEEVKEMSQQMLNNYLLEKEIDFNILLKCKNKKFTTNNELNSDYLVTNEEEYQTFSINDIGEALVFFQRICKVDREFWKEEINTNYKANQLKKQIDINLKIGYMWKVKRTMNQPAIISIYYGFLAIAIANLTDGILYSDDGGWDYRCFPVEAKQFMNEYLNLSRLKDKNIKKFVEECLYNLKLRSKENKVNKL